MDKIIAYIITSGMVFFLWGIVGLIIWKNYSPPFPKTLKQFLILGMIFGPVAILLYSLIKGLLFIDNLMYNYIKDVEEDHDQ